MKQWWALKRCQEIDQNLIGISPYACVERDDTDVLTDAFFPLSTFVSYQFPYLYWGGFWEDK